MSGAGGDEDKASSSASSSVVSEMLLAMVIGMMVLGGVFDLVLAVGGTDFSTVKSDALEVPALVMAFNMVLPMALWMRYCGHSRARRPRQATARSP